MAAVIATYEQAPFWDPYNPTQVQHYRYTQIPGGYGGFYYNRVPTKSTLLGLGAGTMPTWATAAIVGLIGVGAGFFGWKAIGPKVKKTLHLSGHRRRRR